MSSSLNRESILVTGASGYIGHLTLARLVARGFAVHATSRSGNDLGSRFETAEQQLPRSSPADVVWHRADLLAHGVPDGLIARIRPDVVLHFAWNVTPGQYWTSEQNHVWRSATGALARAFFAAGGRRFVGAGTCAEYDWSGGLCDELTTPLDPATLYGQAKLGAWHDVWSASRSSSREDATAAWGRVFWLIGGDEHPSRLVPSVARAIRSGQPALCTHGEQLRDFLHVDDVADAFVALATSEVEGPVNIASGRPHLVREVIEGIAARLDRRDLVRLGARPTTEPPVVTATTIRLADEVGWRPSRTFEQTLNEVAKQWTEDTGRAGLKST